SGYWRRRSTDEWARSHRRLHVFRWDILGLATGGRRGREAHRGRAPQTRHGPRRARRDPERAAASARGSGGTGRADGFRGTAPRKAKGRLMEGMLALMIPIVAVGGFFAWMISLSPVGK